MAKILSLILGVVLTIVGIAGYVVDPVLIFKVGGLHNLVHLASGIVGLLCYFGGNGASKMFLLIFGVIYGVVAILGFLGDGSTVLGLIDINMADNYLHLAIAAVCLGVGLTSNEA